MRKVAVVYWSSTGNTEAMASAVAEGAKEKGAEVSLVTAAAFSPEQVNEYNAIAFGYGSRAAGRVRVRAHVQCLRRKTERKEHRLVRLLRLGRW